MPFQNFSITHATSVANHALAFNASDVTVASVDATQRPVIVWAAVDTGTLSGGVVQLKLGSKVVLDSGETNTKGGPFIGDLGDDITVAVSGASGSGAYVITGGVL